MSINSWDFNITSMNLNISCNSITELLSQPDWYSKRIKRKKIFSWYTICPYKISVNQHLNNASQLHPKSGMSLCTIHTLLSFLLYLLKTWWCNLYTGCNNCKWHICCSYGTSQFTKFLLNILHLHSYTVNTVM